MAEKITETKPLENKIILIVEDDPFITKVYSKWLLAAGAAVVTAPDGVKALELLRQQKIDLMLLDLGMPGLGGYDMLVLLRNTKPELSAMPVIILTNTSMQEDKEMFIKIKKMGVTHILQKYETTLVGLVDHINECFSENTK